MREGKARAGGRRRARIASAICAFGVIGLLAAIPVAGAQPVSRSTSRSSPAASATPDTNLANGQFVTVNWSGFRPTDTKSSYVTQLENNDAVAIYECVADPPGGVYYYYQDCYTAAAPNNIVSGAGTGNAVDPAVNGSEGITGSNGTGTTTFEVQQGTLDTVINQTYPGVGCTTDDKTGCLPDFTMQCDISNPCVLKVVDLTKQYWATLFRTFHPNYPGSPPGPGTWSQVVDDAPSIPLDFGPVPNCPPPSVGSPNVAMEGAPSSEYAVQNWAAQLCLGSNSLTVDYAPLTEVQAKQDLANGATELALASIAPTSGPKDLAAPTDLSGVSIAFNLANPVTHQRYQQVRLTPRLAAMLISDSGQSAVGITTVPPNRWRVLFDDPEFQALNPGFVPPSPLGGSPSLTEPVIIAGARDDVSIITRWIADDYDARRFLEGEDPCAGVDVYWQHDPIPYPTDQFYDYAPLSPDPAPAVSGTAFYTGSGSAGTGLSLSDVEVDATPASTPPGPTSNYGNITLEVTVTDTSTKPISNISGNWIGGTLNGPSELYPASEANGTTKLNSAEYFSGGFGDESGNQTLEVALSGSESGHPIFVTAPAYYVGGLDASPGFALAMSGETINGEPATSNPGPSLSPGTYAGAVTLKNISPWAVTNIVGNTESGAATGPTSLEAGQSAEYTWKGKVEPGGEQVQIGFNGSGPGPQEANDYEPLVSNESVGLDLAYDTPPSGKESYGPYVTGIMGVVDTATANQSLLPSAEIDAASSTSQLSDYVNLPSCTPKTLTSFPGFVAPTQASLDAGVSAMTPGPDGTLVSPVNTTNPDVYPLTKVDYSFVPASGLSGSTAGDISRFLSYAAGPGQGPTVLPPSYPPLPASLASQTRAVAAEVTHEGSPSGEPPRPATTTAPATATTPQGSSAGTPPSGGSPATAAATGTTRAAATRPGASRSTSPSAHGSSAQPGAEQAVAASPDTASGLVTGAWLLPLLAALAVAMGAAGVVLRWRSRPRGGLGG